MKKTLPTQYKKDLGVTAIIKERKMVLFLSKKLVLYIIIVQIVEHIKNGIMKSHEKWILKFGR